MTIRTAELRPAGTTIFRNRVLEGLAAASIPYERGMDLRGRVAQALASVSEQIRVAAAMKDSPFISRGNSDVLAAYVARAETLKAQLALVNITEQSRDVARMNYDEDQILDMLSAADAVAADNPASDMGSQIIRRAAVGGLATMAAVIGGLYLVSRKK